MSEKSYSLPKITVDSPMKREDSLRYISPRLNFPKPGDSSIFSNAGRKHFENHSDKMLKIILPEKFAVDKSINLKREISYPPPHLARHSSEQDYQSFRNAQREPGEVKKYFAKDASLRIKIEDELDKMKRSMEAQRKSVPRFLPDGAGPQMPANQLKSQRAQEPKASSSSSATLLPSISALSSIAPLPSVPSPVMGKQASLPRNRSQLLYNPENKQKYDTILKNRWLSPTNLSTGLSII